MEEGRRDLVFCEEHPPSDRADELKGKVYDKGQEIEAKIQFYQDGPDGVGVGRSDETAKDEKTQEAF